MVVKNAISQYPTLPFLQLRFLLAFLVMVILVRRLPTRKELLVGLVAGAVLAAGYLTQTIGLALITPGNAGLITGLLVLFTPLIDRVWIAIVITGVFASALAYYIQTWAQAHIDASRTALIIAMEPAWAVAAAVVLAGQRFGLLQAAGAALVLAAIVGHELAPLKFKAPEHERIET